MAPILEIKCNLADEEEFVALPLESGTLAQALVVLEMIKAAFRNSGLPNKTGSPLFWYLLISDDQV